MPVNEKECRERVERILSRIGESEKNILHEVAGVRSQIVAHIHQHLGEEKAGKKQFMKKTLDVKYLSILIASSIAVLLTLLGAYLK